MSEVVIGADEVGLGCWAGPLVVCAVAAPLDWTMKGLNDSKKLSPKRRAALYDEIREHAPFIQWFVEWVWPEEIDKIGVGRAQIAAFERVLAHALKHHPHGEIIIDGTLKFKNSEFAYRSMPKADANVPTVMAASILAKVERDRWMQTNGDSEFPNYGFINHVGYGTPEHIKALDDHGPCSLHRLSYEPVARRVKTIRLLSQIARKAGAEVRAEELRREERNARVNDAGNWVERDLNDEEVPF